jgi:lambda family phage minor tail protein L
MALSLQTIQDKNSLGTDAVFHILLSISIPGVPEVTVTNNGENVEWNGKTWLSFPFDISELTEEGSGEVPQWTITLDNKSRVIEKYLSDYDQYLKVNGIEGNEITCTLFIVNSKDLLNNVPIKEVSFDLQSPATDFEKATFVMSVSSPFTIITPKRRFIQQFCYWKFKGIECGYTGPGETCDKTISQCRTYNNSTRYGGFPGVGFGGIRL